ncbi:MAG: hypothetical protein JKY56_04780 [Kofleriaceae bacterium]|nr:hypothetical protein [Kofleriaceae bacterium]
MDAPNSGPKTGDTSSVAAHRRKWSLESQLTARHGAADDDSYQTRIALGVVHTLPTLTMAVFVEFGSARTINVRQFRGDFNGLAVRAQLGYPLALGHWQMEPELSLSVHATTLEGRFAAMVIEESRFNPSIDLGFRLARTIKGVNVGVQLRGTGYTRSQRYLLDGVVILDLPALELAAGLSLRVPIF